MPHCSEHNNFYKIECSYCVHSKAKSERVAVKSKKTPISKNPKDWKNTFNCSDGTKVTQTQINNRLTRSYKRNAYIESTSCLGCGNPAQGHAHIIAQARCKRIGKTELIWNPANYFEACNACNLAIENPKGKDWRYLKNIDHCLLFIKEHDPQLFTKFELSAVNQEKPVI